MVSKKEQWKDKQKRYKQNVQHNFSVTLKGWGKKYCSGCGLLTLNNDATRRAMARPCNSMEE